MIPTKTLKYRLDLKIIMLCITSHLNDNNQILFLHLDNIIVSCIHNIIDVINTGNEGLNQCLLTTQLWAGIHFLLDGNKSLPLSIEWLELRSSLLSKSLPQPLTSNPQPKPCHSFSVPRQIRLVDMFPYKKTELSARLP